jgi:hypothetical protein
MNEKNTQKLYQDFPVLYRDARPGVEDSCVQWGFSCGDGWYQLIRKFSAAIEAEAKKLGLDTQSEEWPRALQVKEKFGTLRFYVVTPADSSESQSEGVGVESVGGVVSIRPIARVQSIRELVSQAEATSAEICETCGAPGSLNTDGGWWRTTCGHCDAKRNEEVGEA